MKINYSQNNHYRAVRLKMDAQPIQLKMGDAQNFFPNIQQ